MVETKAKRLLIVQRVLTKYRYELLKELSPFFSSVTIATSAGDGQGTLRLYRPQQVEYRNVNIKVLPALKLGYSGDVRSTTVFLYPAVLLQVFRHDVLLLEGTTNVLNNLFIVPLAKLLGKKIIWWDSGSSQMVRTPRRKVIDFVMGILIMLTDAQIAYSQKGRRYMSEYMHAGNCHCLLNAINTSYFEGIREEVNHVADTRETNSQQIRLLYVGVVEKRKMVRELIDMVSALNRAGTRTYMLDIVGGGSEYEPLIKYVEENSIRHVKLLGPKYAYEELKPHYFAADIFVLPGDGGLAVLQSVLFGLPVLTVHADGTEEDYLPPECIFSSLGEIQEALLRMEPVKRLRSSDAARFYHINWITGFVELSNQC